MPKNPHDTEDMMNDTEEIAEESSWSEDQKTRSYYYDDACGYEIYENDESEEEENPTTLPLDKTKLDER